MITAGLVDRAIDEWEETYGRSTVKNTVAALVLVLDEAVRDGVLVRNPAKDRARRRTFGRMSDQAEQGRLSPRELALPDVENLTASSSAWSRRGATSPGAMSSVWSMKSGSDLREQIRADWSG